MKRHSLGLHLLIALLTLVLAPVLLFHYLLHNAFQETYTRTAIHNLDQIADKKSHQIDAFIQERLQNVRTLGATPLVMESLKRLSHTYRTEGPDSVPHTGLESEVWPFFHNYLTTNGYYDLFLISEAGDVVFSVRRERDYGTNLRTGPYRESGLARVVETARSVLEADFSEYDHYEPSGEPAAFLAAPVLEGLKMLGVVALQVDTWHFQKVMLDNTGLGESGETVIGRLEGDRVRFLVPLKSDPEAAFNRTLPLTSPLGEPLRRAVQGEGGAGFSRDYRGHPVLAVWRYLPSLRAGMVVKVDRSEALAELTALQRWEYLFLAGVGISLLLITGFLARRVVAPIVALTRTTFAIAEGELDRRAPVAGNDEITQLANSFNTMAAKLQAARTDLEQQVQQRTVALERANAHLLSEIMERQKADERLRETLTLQQAILDSANASIIATTPDGTIRAFNLAAERMLGYRAAEVVGNTTPALLHDPDEVARRAAQLTRELGREVAPGFETFVARARSGEPDEAEWSYIRQDGSRFPVHLSVTAIRDPEGNLTGFLGMATDITQRRLAEERLVLAGKVMENASEAIVVTDPRGIISEVNPAYERILGFAREEVIGKNPRITKSGHHDPEFYQRMWQSLLETGSWEGEIWDRRKNGEVFPKWLSINAIKNGAGEVVNYVGIFLDISHQKATEEKLERLAFYDPLTGLPNRALFRDRLGHELESARRHHSQVGLFFVDLDRFKYVNDTLGHDVGDQLLVEVARRLSGGLRQSDTVCRLGGDEFTVILPGVTHPEELGQLAGSIIERLRAPFHLKEHEVFIGASIGIAIFPDDGVSFEELTKNADVAMYEAKETGRNTYQFFTLAMNRANALRLALEADLRRAIDGNQLTVFYQPKVELRTGRVKGMEALVRWIHPEKGMVSPAHFIPLAEETGLIVPLGEQVLATACAQTREWRERGWPHLQVAVNLSGRQFQSPGLAERIAAILGESGLPPAGLEVEITESVVMADVERTIATMETLKGMGLTISIDDFGTGYSSLSYLKRFPLHALKVDQSFVRDIADNPDDAAIVDAILSMAQSLGLEVIAEGVETKSQLAFLGERGCDLAQGYLFSKPLPADQFQRFLEEHIPGKRA